MSLDKKYPDLGSTQFRINKVLKTSTLKSGFKKLQIQMPDSLDTFKIVINFIINK